MTFSKNTYLVILIFFSAFAAVCAILFTPALPEIAAHLSISPGRAQKSVSIFLVGYALGFLPWGPIANAIGRKKTTLIGIAIAIQGLLISMLIKHYPHEVLLNLGRFLTALGSSVGVKITYTYISDLFTKEEILSKVSYLLISSAAAISLAAVAGGLLTNYFGWFSCLVTTLIYGLVLMACTFILPETLKAQDRIPLRTLNVIQGYSKSLKNTALVKSTLIMGLCTSFTYLFASLAPFIVISEMGLSAKQYGLYNFIPAIGIIFGFYVIKFLKTRVSHFTQIKLGLAIIFLSVLVIVYYFSQGLSHPLKLFITMASVYTGIAVVFANVSTLALGTSEDKSNTSAVMNFLNMSICCFVLFINEAIPIKASLLMPVNFLILSLGMMGFWVILKKDAHFKS